MSIYKRIDMAKNHLSEVEGRLSTAYKKKAEIEHEIEMLKAKKQKAKAEVLEIQEYLKREEL
ncbi:hypothetical protein [Bacillus licheniformis]|uniref:hypothetical protein n=1 Tax=Bacillus licheniformis TaxID=1402 RepID=UPI002E1F56DC|nr:hypothetical protein [Bacillus licheniformis]